MAEHADASSEELSETDQPEQVTSEETSSEAPKFEAEDAEDEHDAAIPAIR